VVPRCQDAVGRWRRDPPCTTSGQRRSRQFQQVWQHARSSSRVLNLVLTKLDAESPIYNGVTSKTCGRRIPS
jgi:hypothetical protein